VASTVRVWATGAGTPWSSKARRGDPESRRPRGSVGVGGDDRGPALRHQGVGGELGIVAMPARE
jgi:hypothetical protein